MDAGLNESMGGLGLGTDGWMAGLNESRGGLGLGTDGWMPD